MRIALTGGSGFVGPSVAKALVEDGHTVCCLVRKNSDRSALVNAAVPLDYVHGDICDQGSLDAVLDGADAIVHVAGLTKALRREDFYAVNVDGTKNLVEAAVTLGVGRFVYCSSLAVAGPMSQGRPLTENDLPSPVSHYGRSKLLAEEILRKYSHLLDVTIVRPPIVYGPRDRDFFELFKMARRGFAVKSGFFSSKRYSIIHVNDLGGALSCALSKGRKLLSTQSNDGIYYVSDGNVYAWEELIEAVSRVLGCNTFVLPVPEAFAWPVGLLGELTARLSGRAQIVSIDKMRESFGPGWACDIARARAELGFTPRYSLAKGLEATARWYLENGWL